MGDTSVEDRANEAFGHLQKAYKVLSDPDKRRAYDAQKQTAAMPFHSEVEKARAASPSWLETQVATESREKRVQALSFRRRLRRWLRTVRYQIKSAPPYVVLSCIFAFFSAAPAACAISLSVVPADEKR